MSHLWTSTLCATATIVGTSAVALALGQHDLEQARSNPSAAQKRKSPSSSSPSPPLSEDNKSEEAVMPSRSRRSSRAPTTISTAAAAAATATAVNAPTPLGLSNLTPAADANKNAPLPAERISYDGRMWSGKVRRLTLGDAAAQRRSDHERSSTSGSDAVHQEAHARPATVRSRSRNSWIKRLSSMSTASNENSRSSSPWPESTVSATLSNAGSTMPIVGSVATPQSPNKLVKRMSSQRLVHGAAGKVPTLRRPATSHQRSATLENWSRAQDRDSILITPDLLPYTRKPSSTEAKWKSFFTVKVNKKGTFSRSTDAPAESKGIRRIVPDDGCYPSLITAKSIVTSTLDVDDFPEYDNDSVFFSSRPVSAFGLDSAVVSNRLSSAAESPANLSDVPQPAQHDREASPRRSLSSLLSRKPSRRGSIRGAANKLTKRIGRRVVSEPTGAASKHQTFTSDTDSEKHTETNQLKQPPGLAEYSQANGPSGTDPALINSPLTFHTSTTASLNEDYSPHITQHSLFSGSPLLSGTSTSGIPHSLRSRLSHHSTAPSDTASSTADSDTDARLMAEFEAGDGAHGHYAIMSNGRPRTSRASRSRRGSESRFETIIDESPPKQLKTPLKDLLPPGIRAGRDDMVMDVSDIIEEETSMGSPVRTIRSDKADNGSPYALRTVGRSPLPRSVHMPSSPPDIAKPLNLGTLEYDDPTMDDDEESRWSGLDGQESITRSDVDSWSLEEQVATPIPLRRSSPFQVQVSSSSRSGSTYESAFNSSESNLRKDLKTTLFAYSEKTTEKSTGSQSPPRPSTVHGKKDADGRGSRANKRRAHGGLHIRSQSVPVVPDVSGKRQAVITNKFGTWGVGSKGVTEDWDEDFDFGDKLPVDAPANGHEEKRTDSMQPIAIPQKIKEHQISVMNNISLVREFGLMIEQLKTLKPRATSLGLVDQATDDLYELVDSMIELADQEAEIPLDRQSPPSSPGFDMSGFDDPITARSNKKTGRAVNANDRHDTVIRTPPTTKSKRKTVLPEENDVFTSPATQADQSKPTTPAPSEFTSRPRKDSEAMARSVIEALKTKKGSVESAMSLQPVPSNRRVQFDTRTLRHIVPYVSGLVRRVKDQIRDAERLVIDSESDWDADLEPRDPPLAHVFRDPSPIPESPSSRKGRHLRAPRLNSKENSPGIDDVNKKLKMMTVM